MAKKAAKRKLAEPDFPYVAAELRPCVLPIDSVQLDPANLRKHDDRSIAAIAASLRQFGVRKPAVLHRTRRIVLAGNGSIQAAKLNGWTHYPFVQVDDDDRTATGFALADNRTAELSEWNEDALRELLQSEDVFDDDELRRMADDLLEDLPKLDVVELEEPPGPKPAKPPKEYAPVEKFQIVLTCRDEAHQVELLERFGTENLECRALNS